MQEEESENVKQSNLVSLLDMYCTWTSTRDFLRMWRTWHDLVLEIIVYVRMLV